MKSSNSLFFYVNLREGLLFGKYKSYFRMWQKNGKLNLQKSLFVWRLIKISANGLT